MKKKIIIIVFILIIFLFAICYTLLKKGHNTSIKSVNDIEKYILNIKSYNANVDIIIDSNKNTNTYKAIQSCNKEAQMYTQEITFPDNVSGIKIKYQDNKLTIENSRLNLNLIYNNYTNILDYDLNLMDFINDCNLGNEYKIYKNNNEIIIETNIKNANKYRKKKLLYIDEIKLKPTKLEIQDINNKTLIYILYNEIEVD